MEMSLHCCKTLNHLLFYRNLRFLKKICSYSSNSSHVVGVELNSSKLDDFTSQLIQKTVNKWCARKTQRNVISGKEPSKSNEDNNIQFLDEDQLNELFQNTIDFYDNDKLHNLIKECVRFGKCPSVSNILPALSVCAQNGDKTTINEVIELCRSLQPTILEPNSNFQHYLAEAIWVRGNITESLNMFKIVYKENTYLRRKIRMMLKYLIVNVVSNHSEAALIITVKFAEDLAKEYEDFFFLTCLWQSCFLSEWFTDQIVALDLLKRIDGLHCAIISRIPYVVAISLRNNRVEVVYRLLEILLEFEMKQQCEGVLLALLDYQMHQRNIRRCLDIMQWSEENSIQLPAIYNKKFLTSHLIADLFLDKKSQGEVKPHTDYKF